MVQIIAIKVEVSGDKRRRKALRLAAAAQGVESVELNGEDQVIVTGDEVDAVCLANTLRKKFGYAKLLSLQHSDGDDGGNGGSDSGGGGGGDEEEPSSPACPYCNNCNYCQFPPPPCPITYVLYDADPPLCSIM